MFKHSPDTKVAKYNELPEEARSALVWLSGIPDFPDTKLALNFTYLSSRPLGGDVGHLYRLDFGTINPEPDNESYFAAVLEGWAEVRFGQYGEARIKNGSLHIKHPNNKNYKPFKSAPGFRAPRVNRIVLELLDIEARNSLTARLSTYAMDNCVHEAQP